MNKMQMGVPALNAATVLSQEGGSKAYQPNAKWEAGMRLFNSNGQVDSATQGYDYTIQTTTFIHARTIEQKFYELDGRNISDYVPVEMGVGAWMEDIKTNLTYLGESDSFEAGLQSLGTGPTRIASMDIGLTPKNAKIHTWVGGFKYTTNEVEKALATNNWNVIESKSKGVKKIFDLGLQSVAFLGLKGDLTLTPGLISNPEITTNTTFMSSQLKDMAYTDFNDFVAGLIALYRANANEVGMPNRLILPMEDYVGLASFVSPQFPNLQKIKALEDAFKMICGQDFQILPLAYSNASRNAGYWATNGTYRYVLYRHDPEVVKMDLPLSFTINAPGTANNFSWETVAYAQFTGVIAYRVPQMLYIDYIPAP